MSSFDGLDLFGSGPHRFIERGRALRFVLSDAPGVDGARVAPLGLAPKRLTQIGRLVAATRAALDAQRAAIEVVVDGRSAELIDAAGTSHPNMMITRFDPTGAVDIGANYSLAYEIEYVEVG